MSKFATKLTAIALAFSIFTATTIVRPRHANAMIAGVASAIGASAMPWFVAAGVSGGLGGILFLETLLRERSDKEPDLRAVGAFIGIFFFWGLGLIFLDGAPGDASFVPLKGDAAPKLGVTTDDIAIYNSEVDELNAERETIVRDALVVSRTAKSTKEVGEFIVKQWSAAKKTTDLSPGTVRVADAISLKLNELIRQKVKK